jgi:hypothetical protein
MKAFHVWKNKANILEDIKKNEEGSSQDQGIHSGIVIPDSLVPDKWYFGGQVLTRF